MLLVAILLATLQSAALTDAQRVAAKEAIERSRDAFVLGEKPPFETRYPRTFFIEQLRNERQREAILKRVFRVSISPADLEREYERIEKTTLAPDQWSAIKNALHGNRTLIEEVFCRPLVVDRLLRWKFDFDPKIHAQPHETARRARAEFLAGSNPAAAVERTISRKAENQEPVATMLEKAKREPAPPRAADTTGAAITLDPEALAVLEKQLRAPGAVSTILEYRDRFEVYRLLSSTNDTWRATVVTVPKENFDVWLEREKRFAQKEVEPPRQSQFSSRESLRPKQHGPHPDHVDGQVESVMDQFLAPMLLNEVQKAGDADQGTRVTRKGEDIRAVAQRSRIIEEVLCHPIVVDRVLRWRFRV